MAAADSDMRHRMNVEDEYFSAIERRDTEILVRDHKIAEQKTQLAEQGNMIRSMVTMLTDAGMPLEEIAQSLGQDIETIKQICRNL